MADDRLIARFQSALPALKQRVRRRFTVDTRALAAFRMGIAIVILVDLFDRASDITLFYTNDGAYPLAAYEVTYTYYNGFSVYALSGEPWFVGLLFCISGLIALLLLVGYKSRLTAALTFFLLCSLHARNPAVLNGGDILFRVLIFLSVFVPLGERWSVDALRRGSAREEVASIGTVVVLLQPVVVFTANAILKHEGELWYAGDALELALRNDAMRRGLGEIIVNYPALLTLLNYGWVVLLAGSSVFLLCTAGRLRALAALAYLSAFVGMFSAMAVGMFPLILITALMPFLTTPFWDRVVAVVPDRWRERLPDREQLGPLAGPPLERRLLDAAEQRGYGIVREFPSALLTVSGYLVLVWILLFSAADVTGSDLPEELDSPYLDEQEWGLYAPDPSDVYAWYVTEVQYPDRAVELRTGESVSFDRPPDATAAYESFRHRKFMRLVQSSAGNQTSRRVVEAYGEWACERARARHGEGVQRVVLHQITQPTTISGGNTEAVERTIYTHTCTTGR
jgi:hypothetical protein